MQKFTGLMGMLQNLVVWFINSVILPILTFCHNRGVFEVLGYIACFEMIYEGQRLDNDEYLGFMLSLTGLIFVLLMAVYSMKLNTKKLRAKITSKKHLKMFLGWVIGISIPI